LFETNDPLNLDAIVTLNYDLLLENAARSFRAARVYYGDNIVSHAEGNPRWLVRNAAAASPSVVLLPLIKLHGSVNWRCASEAFRGRVTVVRDPLASLTSTGVRTSHALRNIPIVPPTWRKDPTRGTLFSNLTLQAIEHLQASERIVVIGYSMPKTDAGFRSMFAKGISGCSHPKIEVYDIVSKDENDNRLKDIFSQSFCDQGQIVYDGRGLKGFITTHCRRV